MTVVRAAVFAALFLCASAFSAIAQTVTLTARDGSLELSGRLLHFDGEFYQLEGNFGTGHGRWLENDLPWPCLPG